VISYAAANRVISEFRDRLVTFVILSNTVYISRVATIIVLKETFSNEEIQEIIYDNSDRCVEKQEYHSVDRPLLMEIFGQVNSCDGLQDMRNRIIRKTAYLISLIPNRQPFWECNRSTAVSTGIDFLRENNLDLPLTTSSQTSELRNIVDTAKKKNKDDPTLLADVENYLLRNVKEYYKFY
jgi:hypothetical protein